MEKGTVSPDNKLITDLKAELKDAYELIFVNEDYLSILKTNSFPKLANRLLESCLNLNSKDSSKPPSTDEVIKPVSLRKKIRWLPGARF